VSPASIRAARIWRPETMLLITRTICDSGNAATGHPALSKAGPDIRLSDGRMLVGRLECWRSLAADYDAAVV